MMPRADTLTNVTIESNPVPTRYNPLGARGAGEAGTVGALPATMNAVMDALAGVGVRELDMPATSGRRPDSHPKSARRRLDADDETAMQFLFSARLLCHGIERMPTQPRSKPSMPIAGGREIS